MLSRSLFLALVSGLTGTWIYLARVDQESRSHEHNDIPGLEVYRSIDELVAQGQESVPELLNRLHADSMMTRRDAAMTLGRIGPPAAPAVPALQQLIGDEVASVRAMALIGLGRIGVGLDEWAPVVALRLGDPDAAVRESAAHVLIAAGSVSEPFAITALRATQPDTRRKALLVLRHVAVDEAAVREGLTLLLNESFVPDDLRDDCIEMLLALDSPSIEVIEEGMVSPRVRTFNLAWSAALEARQKPELAWYSKIVTSTLPRICSDDSRYSAAGSPPQFRNVGDLEQLPADIILNSLMDVGPEAEFIAPALRNLLEKDFLPPARFVTALRILARMGENTDEFVPSLMLIWEKNLSQEGPPGRGVPHLGKAVLEVAPGRIPELLEQLARVVENGENGSYSHYYTALFLVSRLGPAAAPLVPVAMSRLGSEDPDEIRSGLALLSALKTTAAEAAPELTRMLASADEQWRQPRNLYGVTTALIAVDPVAARVAIPRFVEIFHENKPGGSPQRSALDRRMASLQYLFTIDKTDPDFRQCLRVALRSRDPELRLRAAEMLVELDCDIESVVQVLVDDIDGIGLELQSNVVSGHSRQFVLLAQLGPRAGSAVSPLTAALLAVGDHDPSPYIRCLEAIASPERPVDDSTEAAVAALADLLESSEEDVRRAAVAALAAFGPCARKAIPALEAAANDPKNAIAAGRQPFRPGFEPYGYMSRVFRRFLDRKPSVRELVEEALSRIRNGDRADGRVSASH